MVAYIGHRRVWTIPAIDRAELSTVDGRFRVRGPRSPADDRIVIVAIDDDTRRAYPELIQTRRGWARLLDAVTGYRPKVIALDLFFSAPEIILPAELTARVRAARDELAAGPSTTPAVTAARDVLGDVVEVTRGDEILAGAVARAGSIYLGINFHLDGRPQATAPAEPPGVELARYGEVASAGGGIRPPAASSVDATLPAIAAGAVGAGAVNVYEDGDGIARRMPGAIELGGRWYAPLGFSAALGLLNRAGDSGYLVGEDHVVLAGQPVPIGPHAAAHLDFLGPNRAFPRVSAADLLTGEAPRDVLAGRLVFVGYTYGAFDKVATPFDPLTDGVELHATLAHNAMHGELLRPAPGWYGLAAVALLAAAISALQLRRVRRRSWLPPVIAAGLIASGAAAAYLLFVHGGVIVEIAAPASAGVVVLAVAAVTQLATEGREKARLRSAFSQYVSGAVVERILANPAAAHLGGERRELTVLFSDIRGFSGIAEALEPEQLTELLNEYLTPMTDLVLGSGGMLDKYIGDAVMAVWGAPVDVDDQVGRACRTALAMQAALVPLNQGWAAAGLPPVAIGVGVNTGAMAVGNMGSEARFDYTVLGDAVNLAARLEALTKEYGVGILLGEATASAAAASGFVVRELDQVRVKGRGGIAAVFELVGAQGASRYDAADLAAYADALAAYRARAWDRASTGFAALAARHPDDGAAAAMLDRTRALRADPPADDWDGVYDQRSK